VSVPTRFSVEELHLCNLFVDRLRFSDADVLSPAVELGV